MMPFSTGKLRKKTVLDQKEVCFLFQLLKLRKIRGKKCGKHNSLFVRPSCHILQAVECSNWCRTLNLYLLFSFQLQSNSGQITLNELSKLHLFWVKAPLRCPKMQNLVVVKKQTTITNNPKFDNNFEVRHQFLHLEYDMIYAWEK